MNPLEAQTDIQTYLEQGKQALAQGKGREAAIAYAHAAQVEPGNPLAHLGLAEANLALNSYGVVTMACRKTQELATGGPIYDLAQSLLDVLDKRYDQALSKVDSAIKDDPSNAYAHALRAYLLRVTHQDYDAGLARGRASRLSFGGKFENCFPAVEPVYGNGYTGTPTSFTPPAQTPTAEVQQTITINQDPREQTSNWSSPNTMQRRMIRTRFWLSQRPRFVTLALISINVIVYLITALVAREFLDFTQDQNGFDALVNLGAQANVLVAQGQIWRIFTAMFLHESIPHIALNMLSLYFVGSAVELFYGKGRYLLIYLVGGIAGGIVTYFFASQNTVTVGASGAIFAAFGALGVFYIINRRSLGPSANAAIGNWVFWLLLNLAFSYYDTGISLTDHLGGLIAGIILGLILLPPLRRRIRKA
jgi:membrane associated rhomboid family serine protease